MSTEQERQIWQACKDLKKMSNDELKAKTWLREVDGTSMGKTRENASMMDMIEAIVYGTSGLFDYAVNHPGFLNPAEGAKRSLIGSYHRGFYEKEPIKTVKQAIEETFDIIDSDRGPGRKVMAGYTCDASAKIKMLERLYADKAAAATTAAAHANIFHVNNKVDQMDAMFERHAVQSNAHYVELQNLSMYTLDQFSAFVDHVEARIKPLTAGRTTSDKGLLDPRSWPYARATKERDAIEADISNGVLDTVRGEVDTMRTTLINQIEEFKVDFGKEVKAEIEAELAANSELLYTDVFDKIIAKVEKSTVAKVSALRICTDNKLDSLGSRVTGVNNHLEEAKTAIAAQSRISKKTLSLVEALGEEKTALKATLGRFQFESQKLTSSFMAFEKSFASFKVETAQEVAKANDNAANAVTRSTAADANAADAVKRVQSVEEASKAQADGLKDLNDAFISAVDVNNDEFDELNRRTASVESDVKELKQLKQQQQLPLMCIKTLKEGFGVRFVDFGVYNTLVMRLAGTNLLDFVEPLELFTSVSISSNLAYDMVVSNAVIKSTLPEGCSVEVLSLIDSADDKIWIRAKRTTEVQLKLMLSSPRFIIPSPDVAAFTLLIEDSHAKRNQIMSPGSKDLPDKEPVEIEVFIQAAMSQTMVVIDVPLGLVDHPEKHVQWLINERHIHKAFGGEIAGKIKELLKPENLAQTRASCSGTHAGIGADEVELEMTKPKSAAKSFFSRKAVPKAPRPVDANVLPQAPSTPAHGTSTPARNQRGAFFSPKRASASSMRREAP